MANPLVAVAGITTAAYGVAKGIGYLNSSSHNWELKKAYKAADQAIPDSADIFVDHVTGQPTPHGEVDGLTHIPDMVIRGGPAVPNVIAEVETKDSLENARADAQSQVEDFKTLGYRRFLVVPSDAIEQAEALVESVDGTVTVTTGQGIGDLLAD